MRVATFNIRHGAAPGKCSNIDGFARAVDGLGAEVVALQEVDRRVFRSGFRDQAARIAERGNFANTFASARRVGPLSGYGNALLTRVAPSRTDVLQLRSLDEPRVAIICEVELSVGRTTLVSTHLQNARPGRPPQAVSQLEQLLSVLSLRPEPWVLMGDFNLRPEVVVPRLAEAGLVATSVTPTFPADSPRIPLDWIAVKGLEVIDSAAVNIRLSDHRPVVAELARQPK